MIDEPFDAYVGKKNGTKLYGAADGKSSFSSLLWGDGVRFLDPADGSGRRKVKARGLTGWVETGDLDGESLLEFYFIDVGQGDGILIKTPDFRHILIDGGYPRSKQPSGKGAADFVDWKFVKDYGLERIELDALISSHNDEDHYGGLSDLLDIEQLNELDAKGVSVESFYHAGVSWWAPEGEERNLGDTEELDGKQYLVDLIDDRNSAIAGLEGVDGKKLQGMWGKFIQRVAEASTSEGEPVPFARLSDETLYLPAFEPDASEVSILILAPIEREIDGRPAVRSLGSSPDKNTNGNSILMRLDYGRTRTLLTGDLNKAAHQDILEALAGSLIELQCDVAKACHHGSSDVSLAFLQAMEPSATIISSGDAEGHDHPKPAIVAASGATGHLTVRDDEIITPLVYSTELARSYTPGKLIAIKSANGTALEGDALEDTRLHCKVVKAGDLNPTTKKLKAAGSYLIAGLVYGLVNVRTDGEWIMTATMDEKSMKWSTKGFTARF